MDREQVLKMDVFMLLSIVNMKLRDEFESLNSLCEYYNIAKLELNNRLNSEGFFYNEETNQFISH